MDSLLASTNYSKSRIRESAERAPTLAAYCTLTTQKQQLLFALCSITLLVFVGHTVVRSSDLAPDSPTLELDPSSTSTSFTTSLVKLVSVSEPVIESKYFFGPQITITRMSVWFSEHGMSQATVEWQMFCSEEKHDCKARVSGGVMKDCEGNICKTKEDVSVVCSEHPLLRTFSASF
eukprot:c6678_g1_i1.p1 GENE.c6678_g1_i1~~c6678_g1_i1.p1  ORF type:complete len:205 (-),score=49.61 c6678_g1_i1:58-588(-)